MKKIFAIIILSLVLFLNAGAVFAQNAQTYAGEQLDKTAGAAGLEAGDPAATIGAGIRVVLSILGVVFLVLVVYGGILWMTAGGDPKTVEKARSIIIEGVLGMLICLAAYSIAVFVVERVTQATSGAITP